mmetsp:Transcript_74449/g.118528  ORF Transcript_74449/g.118528 Transcript_74449/m.118528 type:complete len:87 (+) Transcript_74449:15-275(+)
MSADLAPQPLDKPFANNADEDSIWYRLAFIGLCVVFVVNLIVWMNILRANKLDEWRENNDDKPAFTETEISETEAPDLDIGDDATV